MKITKLLLAAARLLCNAEVEAIEAQKPSFRRRSPMPKPNIRSRLINWPPLTGQAILPIVLTSGELLIEKSRCADGAAEYDHISRNSSLQRGLLFNEKKQFQNQKP
jgi:hypothetical protein